MEVTARELKLRLGRYLAAVRRGESLSITLRGKPIAELRPLPPSPDLHLDRLAAAGLVTLGAGQLGPHKPAGAQRSASDIILADRDSERS